MEEKSSKLSIFVKIITIAFAIALISFVVFFSIHLYRSTIYDMFKEIIPSEQFKAAYAQNDDIRTHDVGTEGLSQNGVIKITKLVYIESPSEAGKAYMQFGLRINKLHVEEVQEACPSVKYEDISFHLVGKKGTDPNGNPIIIYDEQLELIESGEKYQYKFYKFEKNDVSIDADSLYVEMRIDGITVGTNEKGDKTLIESADTFHVADSEEIHYLGRKSVEYKLSRKEKKLLG